MRRSKLRSCESGMALVLALLALLVISAIGLGMMFMTNTETSINANYKDAQLAFYAMRGGLEEMRDRMRSQSISPITLPTTMPGVTPGGGATSVLYITNPAAGESFNPTSISATNKYGFSVFDDEFCREYFSPSMTSPGTLNVPCPTYPSGNTVSTTGSYSSNSTTPPVLQNSPLNFKWVRITLKQNGTFNQGSGRVDSGQGISGQVCWDGMNNQEVVSTALGGSATCKLAIGAGYNVQPVYIVTSLAVTPSGSRRIGQYETAAFSLAPPPGALGLDGPGAGYGQPSSGNTMVDGDDGSSPSDPTCANGTCTTNFNGPGGTTACSPTGDSLPAVSVGDTAGQTSVVNSVEGITPTGPDRRTNYIGSGGTPSVVVNTQYSSITSAWSNTTDLNTMVSELANAADVTYPPGPTGSCGYHNSALGQSGSVPAACTFSGTSLGTVSAPQITYVNGDFTLSGTTTGYGVLVVTGTLTFSGNFTFSGLVLVVGQGAIVASGGGHGTFYGSVFVANTNSHSSPYGQLSTLGQPTLDWSGGGGNGIYYNSCWANVGNNLHYMVLASREEMY
jgi:hypothetical protein